MPSRAGCLKNTAPHDGGARGPHSGNAAACGRSALARLRPPRPTSPHTHTASPSPPQPAPTASPQPPAQAPSHAMGRKTCGRPNPMSLMTRPKPNSKTYDPWMAGSHPPSPTPPRTAPRARATGLSVTLRRHRPTRVNCGRRLHALPRDTTRRRRAPARRGGPPTRFPLPSIGKPEKYLAGHTPFAPHALAGAALLSRRAPLSRIVTLRCARAG